MLADRKHALQAGSICDEGILSKNSISVGAPMLDISIMK